MPDVFKVLALSQRIAKKARRLIPRSSNRIGSFTPDRQLLTSRYDEAPNHVQLMVSAMRARKDQNELRRRVFRTIPDISFESDLRWPEIVENVEKELGSIKTLDQQLKTNPLSRKQVHKDNKAVMPKEMIEAEAKNAVRYRVGNCGENSALAYVMFLEYPGPENDDALPELDPNDPVTIERVCVAASLHCFVVVNRNPSVSIQDVTWLNNSQVIICDPWWFHGGDAFRVTNKGGYRQSLLNLISGRAEQLSVTATGIMGEGHTERFRNKHPELNFYRNSDEITINQLRFT